MTGSVAGGVVTATTSSLTLGGALVSGGAVAGIGTAAAVTSVFAGGLVGSAVSQVVGKALGAVESFSLRKAVAGGFTSVASAGIAGALKGSKSFIEGAKKGALNNLGRAVSGASNVIAGAAANKIVGLPSGFRWANVVANASTGYIGGRFGLSDQDSLFAGVTGGGFSQDFFSGVANSALNYAVTKGVFNEGSWNTRSVVANAFGSAIGNSIVAELSLTKEQKELRKVQNEIEKLKDKLAGDDVANRKVLDQLSKNDTGNSSVPVDAKDRVITIQGDDSLRKFKLRDLSPEEVAKLPQSERLKYGYNALADVYIQQEAAINLLEDGGVGVIQDIVNAANNKDDYNPFLLFAGLSPEHASNLFETHGANEFGSILRDRISQTSANMGAFLETARMFANDIDGLLIHGPNAFENLMLMDGDKVATLGLTSIAGTIGAFTGFGAMVQNGSLDNDVRTLRAMSQIGIMAVSESGFRIDNALNTIGESVSMGLWSRGESGSGGEFAAFGLLRGSALKRIGQQFAKIGRGIKTGVGRIWSGAGSAVKSLTGKIGGYLNKLKAKFGPNQMPLGFGGTSDFKLFGKSLHGGLDAAGFKNVDAAFQGSSVTGRAFKAPHDPFDVGRVSDFDIALSSEGLFEKARDVGVGLRAKGTRTGPLSLEKTPDLLERMGLTQLSAQLALDAGRPVNFMIFKSIDDAISRSQSIILPRP